MRNVLLISADHMRGDALACNGNSFVKTPNLDALAESGATFRRCYTPNPICVPARASITTGNYSHVATGRKNNGGLIRDGQNKIAEVFARAGYETYALGKLHYVPYSPPAQSRLLHGFQHAELCEEGRIIKSFAAKGGRRGLEDYADYLEDVGYDGYTRAHGLGNNDLHPCPSPLPAEHYVDAWVAARTIANLETHQSKRKDRPFFAWMSFVKPHPPYDPPQPYDRLYDPLTLPKPFGAMEDRDHRNPFVRTTAYQHGIDFLSPEAIQVMRAHYYGMVTFQDEMVGRVMSYLEAAGLRENTIVVYVSDHGDLLGDFGGCFKCNFQEGAVRVPLIISAPGQVAAMGARDELAGSQDILPTLAAMTGVEPAYPTHGRDLSPVLAGKGGVREVIFSQCKDSPWQMVMACDGRWKYGYCEANAYEELYDLESDPTELRNLIPEGGAPEEAARLRREIVRWCRETGDESMLAGDDLARSEVDVDALCTFSPGSMGWRWY